MNHTERIAETARRHRHLNRRLVKDAVETYLDLLAEEIAGGEWVDIYEIGRIRVLVEKHGGSKKLFRENLRQDILNRLRTQVRLGQRFKDNCYSQQKEKLP